VIENVTGIDTGNDLASHFPTMRRKKRSTTIQDVAIAAGVSVSTVSRVLNNKDDIAPETYERVKTVIAEMGYTSSLAARSMRSLRKNVIGLIIPDAGEPFPIEVMKGVNSAIAALEYDLIIYTCGDGRKHYTADREKKFVALLNNSITDGVIVVTPEATHFNTSAPVVAVDPHYEINEYPSVISTNWEGAMEAMNYLISLGHRRIGYISGRYDLQSAISRLRGYQDALAQAGIPIDPELITQGDFTADSGVRCARQLLSLANRPTAIFAANDQSALGAYQAAHEAGLAIPDDLSIIGFDNIPEAAQSEPCLTTVHQPIQEMGKIAVQMLLKLIEGETLEEKIIKTSTCLVIRDSCRAVEPVRQ
jgi:LacI family transcriptional regulator